MAANAKVASIYVQLQAQTAEFKKALAEANIETRKWSATMREETQKSRESIRLLNEDLGVHLPRGLQNIISKLPAVTTAMNAAFDAVVVFAMIDAVVKVTEKVMEFAKKTGDAAQKHRESWAEAITPINDTNDKLELTKTKLENAIAKLQHKPENKLKEAIEEAKVAADDLGRSLDADIKKIAESLTSQQHNEFAQSVLHQTGANAAAGISKDVADKFNQIAAGTYKGTGDQTKDRDAVIAAALAAAYKQLGPAQATLDSLKRNGTPLENSSSAEAVRTLTELIAGLKGMQTTSTLTQGVAADKGKLGILEGDKASADEVKKALGIQVAEMVKLNEFQASEQKRIDKEVEEYGVEQLKLYTDEKVRADKEDENSDKQKAEAFKQNVASQIQVQRDLITTASERYKNVDKAATERVRMGEETPEGRNQELAQAAGVEADAKAAAYQAIADLLFTVGKGQSPEAIKAGDDAVTAEEEGQQKIYDVHAQYAEEIRLKWLNALSGVNAELANMMTGQRTNWRGMFRGEANQMAQSGLSHLEGMALNALGIGGKADGKSKATALWTRNADATAGASPASLIPTGDSNGGGFSGFLKGLLGVFMGGHALGGPALAGVPIPVGELGPETFIPSTPGTVIPHSALGAGAPTIGYIDARGTDPALSRENVARAIAATHSQAVRDSARASMEAARRQPR
jgi:hypothetical protein